MKPELSIKQRQQLIDYMRATYDKEWPPLPKKEFVTNTTPTNAKRERFKQGVKI